MTLAVVCSLSRRCHVPTAPLSCGSGSGTATAVISALGAAAVRYLRSQRVRVINVKRAHEAHAVTVALSTASERSFVTFDGVNVRVERRLLRAMRRQRPRHVHFALAPIR